MSTTREGSAVQLDERLDTDQQHPGHGPQVDDGTTWSDPEHPGHHVRVTWNSDSGDLYLANHPDGDGIQILATTVEQAAVDDVLTGWAQHACQPRVDSLQWVRDRVDQTVQDGRAVPPVLADAPARPSAEPEAASPATAERILGSWSPSPTLEETRRAGLGRHDRGGRRHAAHIRRALPHRSMGRGQPPSAGPRWRRGSTSLMQNCDTPVVEWALVRPIPDDPAFAERFWTLVGVSDRDGHRMWLGGTFSDDGYGIFTWTGPDGQRWKFRAHRVRARAHGASALPGPMGVARTRMRHAGVRRARAPAVGHTGREQRRPRSSATPRPAPRPPRRPPRATDARALTLP